MGDRWHSRIKQRLGHHASRVSPWVATASLNPSGLGGVSGVMDSTRHMPERSSPSPQYEQHHNSLPVFYRERLNCS
jgi:hypothetical protein